MVHGITMVVPRPGMRYYHGYWDAVLHGNTTSQYRGSTASQYRGTGTRYYHDNTMNHCSTTKIIVVIP